MNSILIVFEKPKTSSMIDNSWKLLTAQIEEIAQKDNNIQLLGENVLLISLDKSLSTIGSIVPLLAGFAYKYIIFHEEIQWHEVPTVI